MELSEYDLPDTDTLDFASERSLDYFIQNGKSSGFIFIIFFNQEECPEEMCMWLYYLSCFNEEDCE